MNGVRGRTKRTRVQLVHILIEYRVLSCSPSRLSLWQSPYCVLAIDIRIRQRAITFRLRGILRQLLDLPKVIGIVVLIKHSSILRVLWCLRTTDGSSLTPLLLLASSIIQELRPSRGHLTWLGTLNSPNLSLADGTGTVHWQCLAHFRTSNDISWGSDSTRRRTSDNLRSTIVCKSGLSGRVSTATDTALAQRTYISVHS